MQLDAMNEAKCRFSAVAYCLEDVIDCTHPQPTGFVSALFILEFAFSKMSCKTLKTHLDMATTTRFAPVVNQPFLLSKSTIKGPTMKHSFQDCARRLVLAIRDLFGIQSLS